MRVIGQPESYSDILGRVFITTLFTGVCCTALLGYASPEVRRVLEWVRTPTDVGPIKGIPLLYVAIPLLVALFSRVILLHDKVSDLLGLRKRIDTEWILYPLAAAVGVQLTDDEKQRLKLDYQARRDMMYEVFYPYVTLPDVKIDRQLVRTALDNLGWLWAFLEGAVLFFLSAVVAALVGSRVMVLVFALLSVAALSFTVALWSSCHKSSNAQVRAIIQNPLYASEVRGRFARMPSDTGRGPH